MFLALAVVGVVQFGETHAASRVSASRNGTGAADVAFIDILNWYAREAMGVAPLDLYVSFVNFHLVVIFNFAYLGVFVCFRGQIHDMYLDLEEMGKRYRHGRAGEIMI